MDLNVGEIVEANEPMGTTSPKCNNPKTELLQMNNQSFRSILTYESDDDDEEEEEEERFHSSTSSDTDSNTDSTNTSSVEAELILPSSDEDDSDSDTSLSSSPSSRLNENRCENQKNGAIRKNPKERRFKPTNLAEELCLPPIGNLSLAEEEEACRIGPFVHMGYILGVIDEVVTVEAVPNQPAYDLDTLLFLDNGRKPLGFVCDVIGQVTAPIYVIRHKRNDSSDVGVTLTPNTKVYSAPRGKYTRYVFMEHLLKMKGSDASWEGDTEVPLEFADYSDDEEERAKNGKKGRQGQRKRALGASRSSPPPRAFTNHRNFERAMNQRNILRTNYTNYLDWCRQQGEQEPQMPFERMTFLNTPPPGTSNFFYNFPPPPLMMAPTPPPPPPPPGCD